MNQSYLMLARKLKFLIYRGKSWTFNLFDLRFPQMYREMSKKGALFNNSICFYKDHWKTSLANFT